LYLNDSVRHRRFGDELVDLDRKAEVLKELNIPWWLILGFRGVRWF
jgi:hypothetical protein